ncbi:uncharacterized protein Z518_00355 [Rhinocladiella mackenziei CBS 650.93]|uniref:ER transporter 6TM N-terminal domain-containing protein n=1 Tax=Rhinocladiella mackenziei CBS 650.93 TaxID=1442369 RepID=A0A0D2J0R0_9EURO|nr:uncharacterized protein Z518_00355 [Rhinocladiella mackenziei CBS 650.93]KIX09276.1 hypothetical protein Z518_00355 [Rhinocladiella mackenziei CBS 650.93]
MANDPEATDVKPSSSRPNGVEHPETVPSPEMEANAFFRPPNQSNTKKRKLPPILDHFNVKDLKVLFKCSLSVWIITLFIVIDPVLRAYGQALFFGCIVLFIAPPSGIVSLQIMIGITVLLGMGLAWAWGCITMKAALAARPPVETNQRLGQLAQEASQNATYVGQLTGQTTYAQVLVYDGFMLDARVTAIYFCMSCLFIYFLARLRVAAPKFILIQMFGTMVTDIYLTTAPLLPSFSGTIPTVLIKPAATAVGVGIFCNICFFPESTSHIVLANIKEMIAPMGEFVDACRISFDNSTKPMSIESLRRAKAAGIASYKTLEGRMTFLPLDVSIGRWNAEDIGLLKIPLKHVFVTWASLLESQLTRAESRMRIDRLLQRDDARRNGADIKDQPKFGQHQLALQLDFARLFQSAESEDLVVKSMTALRNTSDPLLATCKKALEAIMEILQLVNERKFYRRPSADTWETVLMKHTDILKTLRKNSQDFLNHTPTGLLDPHAHFFDKDGLLNPPPESGMAPMRGLVIGLILEERIISFAQALEHLLAQIVALEEQRTRTRLWMPTGLRHLTSWIFGREPAAQVTPVLAELEQEQKKSKPKRRRRRRRHRHAGKNGEELWSQSDELKVTASRQLTSIHLHRGKERSRLSRFTLSVIRWFSNTEGMFALRMLIVTIALAIPAVIPSSAGFYFRQKGLWALIMGQISLVPYAADFTWGLMLRVAGTVIGGVLGMVAWYIGAGSGDGNPYGIAAIMVPFIILLMWGRLFGPPALLQAFMLAAATAYLTVAYSWVDTHIPSYGNPGVGYNVFWRRILLVLVGFAAAAIVMYFPRPPSAGRHYRRVLSATLSKFQDIYALFISEFPRNHRGDDNKHRNPEPISTLEKTVIASADTLSTIAGPIQLLRFEFSSSDFTSAGLSQLTALATRVNFNLFQLFYYSSQLPDDFRRRLRLLSGVFEEHFVGDFMAVLSLLSHALETGQALPSVLSAPLTVRAFRDRVIHTPGSKKEQHVRKLLGPVTRAMIENEQEGFRKYCVVLSALVGLLNAVDEMVLVVKDELGESHIVDIESWGAEFYPDAEHIIEIEEHDEKDGLLRQ